MKLKSYTGIAAFFLALALAMPIAAESEILKSEATVSYYGEEFNGQPTSSGEKFDMNALTAAHKTLPFGTMLELTNLDNGKKVVVRVNDRGPFVEDRELDVSKAAAIELDMIATGTARVSIRKIDGPATAVAVAATSPAEASVPAQKTATVASSASAPAPVAAPVAPAPVTAPAAVASPVASSAPVAAPLATPAPAPAPAPVTIAPPQLANTSTGLQWRIQLGSFSHEDNAARLVAKLRKDGFNPAYEKTGNVTRVVIAGVEDKDLKAIRTRLDADGYGSYIVRQEAW